LRCVARGTAKRERSSGAPRASEVAASIAGGLRFVGRPGPIRALIVYSALSQLCALGFVKAGLALIANASRSPAADLGMLLAVEAGGEFLGTAGAARLLAWPIGKWLFMLQTSALVRGMLLAAIAMSLPMFPATLVGVALFGVVRSFGITVVLSTIQRVTPHDLMGRVFSVLLAMNAMVAPVSLLTFSLLDRRLGLQTTLVLLGIAASVAVVPLVRVEPLSDPQRV
jgi:hypothetical protein